MTALFQHRHYVEIAHIIANLDDRSERSKLATYFAMALKGSNPNFDRERFYNAAMGEPKPRDRSR